MIGQRPQGIGNGGQIGAFFGVRAERFSDLIEFNVRGRTTASAAKPWCQKSERSWPKALIFAEQRHEQQRNVLLVPRRGIERINKIRYLNKKVGQHGPIGLQGFFWNCPTYVAGREDRPNATVCHPQS
jgi:hypothetical protein